MDEVDPLVLVEVRQHLGVAAGAEAVPPGLERGAQRGVVVYLAVAHRDHVARLVGERLRAARDVDDREPPAADATRAAHRPAVAVGAAMHERRAHAREDRLRVGPDHAVDAAHPSYSPRPLPPVERVLIPFAPVAIHYALGRLDMSWEAYV